MANTFLTVKEIADEALATLYENTILKSLVHTDLTSEFTAKKVGNTIDIRKPAVFTANRFNRATGIVLQDATESSIPVVLDKISDVSVPVTDEDMSMKIEDFGVQILTPAMEAIAQDVDLELFKLRAGISQVAGTHASAVADGQTWDQPEVLIEAGRLLDSWAVPVQERYAVVGSTTKAKWLNAELLKHADKSGSTLALRNGSLGNDLFGFNAYQTGNVGQPKAPGAQVAGDPTTEIGLAFHSSAFAFASAPLQIPAGANVGQVAVSTYKGLSLRVAYGWDINKKQSVVSVDMLFGTKLLDANRAVLLKGPNK